MTTRRLHTRIEDVRNDLDWIIRDGGILDHMTPRVLEAITPWLRRQVTDQRFWDGRYDTSHTGDYPLPQMTVGEAINAFVRFAELSTGNRDRDGSE